MVTGAAGFIGSRLAERLAADGDDVRGVDAFTPYYDPAIKRATATELRSNAGVEVIDADLRTEPLNELLDGVDTVYHFAAQPGVRPSWATFGDYVEHNVLATQRLLHAACAVGCRVVLASSSSVYGQVTGAVDEEAPTRPHSPYGVTKLAAESLGRAYAHNFGLPVVALRLFTVYGPRQRPDMAMSRLIHSALGATPFPMYGDGSQVRAFTYLDDVVDAARAAAAANVRPGSMYNISGGTTCTLADVISAVEACTGRPVPLERHPPSAGDVERTEARIDRAAQELAWTPRVDLSTGLAKQIEASQRRATTRS